MGIWSHQGRTSQLASQEFIGISGDCWKTLRHDAEAYAKGYDVCLTSRAILWHDCSYLQIGEATVMVYDQGSIFTSKFWSSLCFFLGIESRLLTAFYAQTNGQSLTSSFGNCTHRGRRCGRLLWKETVSSRVVCWGRCHHRCHHDPV